MKTESELTERAREAWGELYNGHNIQNIGRKELAIDFAVAMVNRVAADIQKQTREECAKVAEAHAATIGELCWNHENTNEAVSNCSIEIAAAIRDLERGGE